MESYLWIGIVAYVLWAISATVDKYVLKEHYYPLVIDFTNMLLNSLFILIAAMLFFEITLPTIGQLGFAILLGLIYAVHVAFYFLALNEGDVTRVVPFNKSGSILLIFLFGMLFFNELAVWYNYIGILLLLLGIFLIVGEGKLPKWGRPMFYSLLCIISYVIFQLLAKWLLFDMDPVVVAFLFHIVAAAAVGIYLLSQPKLWKKAERTFDLNGLSHVLISSIFGAGGALLLFIAVSMGPASKVYPLEAVQVALIAIFGMLFLGEKVTWQRWLGILVLVFGIVLVSL